MGRSRKNYNKYNKKSSHLQYTSSRNPNYVPRDPSSESDTSESNSTSKEENGSGFLAGCSSMIFQNSANITEELIEAESYFHKAEAGGNDNTRTNKGVMDISSLSTEKKPISIPEDIQGIHNITLHGSAPLLAKTVKNAEKIVSLGKQDTESKLVPDNPISQSSLVLSELLKQCQRLAVKKVSNIHELPDKVKSSEMEQVSSYSPTNPLNKDSDQNSEACSVQVISSNIWDSLDDKTVKKPSGKIEIKSAGGHQNSMDQSPSINSENAASEKQTKDKQKRGFKIQHQNFENQPSSNDSENNLNAVANEGRSHANESKYLNLINKPTRKDFTDILKVESAEVAMPTQKTQSNYVKYKTCGVQTNEFSKSCDCFNSGKGFIDKKKILENNSKLKKTFSDDKKEFIKKENKLNNIQYSGKIRLDMLDSTYQFTFGHFGSEIILVIDSTNYEKFVGSIKITSGEELQFNEPFEHNKMILLERILITKILTDELFNKRNKAYDEFILTLEKRSKTISEDFNCTEDFLQFFLIGRSQNLSLDQPILFLKHLIQNDFISKEVKLVAKQLMEAESLLYNRNQFFPKFTHSSNPAISDLFAAVRNTCQEGIANHKRNLLNKCPNKSFHLVCLVVTINRLPGRNLLYINNKDIELFSNIMELTYEKDYSGTEIFPVNFVEYLWNNFFKKIQMEKAKSLKELGPMTHPIYYFLLKTLRDIIADISSKTRISINELISNREGELVMVDSISWSSDNPVNKSLEEQYRLVFKLLKHFEPGNYSPKNKFSYKFKLLKEDENPSLFQTLKKLIFGNVHVFKDVPQERIVWLYIVDSAIAPILGDKFTSRFKQLSLSVVTGFVKFIQTTKHDRYESFRVATHNIIKFTSQISPYFSDINSILTEVDHVILNKQIDIISGLLCPEDNDVVTDNFSDLMMIYNEYWEHREKIVGKLPIPCSLFKSDVEIMMKKLIAIVQKALLKDFRPQLTIKFLRLYNEFLKHLKGIDFTWFISGSIYFPGLDGVVEKVIKNDVVSYKVTEPDEFVQRLRKNQKVPPKHFSIEVVKKLLDVVSMSFDKNDWDDEDCVKAAGDLFLAVGHSCSHFEDQTDYTDLEHFVRDCTIPFCCVIENSSTYSEFKQRLENVENFYLYSRKLNQIGIEQALDLCAEGVKDAGKNGFQTKIERSVLEECYSRYSKKLATLKHMQVNGILDDIAKELNNVKQLTLNQWSLDFKRNTLPILLADLAAVWSLQESKDVADINKRIEPHCVQILCVLRLLGVDHDASGVPKHFAQVLTGQGKSLILALLSAIIALTGNEAFVVCYSDYLANRDKKSFDPFFKTFNRFRIQYKISYNTFSDMAENTLSRKVDGVKRCLRTVVSDLIANKLQKQMIDTISEPKNTILLIDEADVFFSDDFYGNTYNPLICVGIPELLKIQPKIWSIIEDGVSEKSTILRKIKTYINDIVKDEECDDFRNFLKTTSDLFEMNLVRMVEDAIAVSKYKIDDKYKIDETGLLKTKSHTFVYKSGTISGYLNTFHYFRLKKENYEDLYYNNFGYLLARLGSISYASLPVTYENILGVSGTLMTLNESEKNAIKNYGIQTMSTMPSFFGKSKLVFKPDENVSIFDTQDNWFENIFENASKNIHDDQARAILIFFESDDKIKLFEEKYRNRINRLYTLTGNEKPDTLEWRINESGISQTVTLATRTMGRGVDYKSNDHSVEENGGVHVIQTFFSLDEKEETQIKGRTARKDNKGSYEMILCREQLETIKCSKNGNGTPINTYAELCKVRQEIANNKGAEVEKNIRRSEKTHNKTIEFFESLKDYSPEKRHKYFSKFPFVNNE